MKKSIFYLCAAALILTACNKEEPKHPTGANSDIADTTQTYPASAEVIRNAVTDIDGHCYDAVRIGNQVWMASNLRTTRFANGEAIPEGDHSEDITTPCRYTSNAHKPLYGQLYNWMAVMHGAESSNANPSGVQGICPNGWHVPSDAEWNEMEATLTDDDVTIEHERGDHAGKLAGGSRGTWDTTNIANAPGNYNYPERNCTGFSILPAGGAYIGITLVGQGAHFWTSTAKDEDLVWSRFFEFCNEKVGRDFFTPKYFHSIRCVKDGL